MLKRLWPARSQKVEGPVTDLDAIVADPVYFRYGGKIHKLEPMSLEHFLRFTNAQNTLMNALKDDVNISPKELAERYHKVVSSVCETISVDDILNMEQAQVAALYQLVIDLVTGQVDLPTEDMGKKKRQRLNLRESVQPSSSPNSQADLVGQSESH